MAEKRSSENPSVSCADSSPERGAFGGRMGEERYQSFLQRDKLLPPPLRGTPLINAGGEEAVEDGEIATPACALARNDSKSGRDGGITKGGDRKKLWEDGRKERCRPSG